VRFRRLTIGRSTHSATSATSATSGAESSNGTPSEVAPRLRPHCDLAAGSNQSDARSQPGRNPPATSETAQILDFPPQVAEVAEVAASGDVALPEEPCTACGCGSFVQPPGERWRCRLCEPVALPPAHEQAGWAFVTVPGGVPTKLTKPISSSSSSPSHGPAGSARTSPPIVRAHLVLSEIDQHLDQIEQERQEGERRLRMNEARFEAEFPRVEVPTEPKPPVPPAAPKARLVPEKTGWSARLESRGGTESGARQR